MSLVFLKRPIKKLFIKVFCIFFILNILKKIKEILKLVGFEGDLSDEFIQDGHVRVQLPDVGQQLEQELLLFLGPVDNVLKLFFLRR